ncbi:endonuclease [Kaistella palustris]|uniref:endonuclease n=1 Tax=Kaistella palustris TaxID=493376 RepID=UPI00041AEC36|nr:endonuclease [Kaistella palustris]
MKKIFTVLLAGIFSAAFAQAPPDYYNGTAGLTGYTLKSKLSEIISDGALDLGYGTGTGGLWETFYTSDVDKYYENNGTVLDMYSERPAGPDAYEYRLGRVTDGGNQCGTTNSMEQENSCYNREHTLPKSFFGGINARPMANDAHFIIPADYYVNGQRFNYPYGETNDPDWTSSNGSKVGGCSFPDYGGTIFEPIDEFKGDLARMQLYFITRYETKLQNFSQYNPSMNPIDGSRERGYKQWYINLLLKWALQDPVSQKEIDRNNAIYARQKNRNPFIDHPEWVFMIWNSTLSSSEVAAFKTRVSVYPNPVRNGEIHLAGYGLEKIKEVRIYNMEGRLVKSVSQDFSNLRTVNIKELPKGNYILRTEEQSLRFIIN